MYQPQAVNILSRRFLVAGALAFITFWLFTYRSHVGLDALGSRLGGLTKGGQQPLNGWLSQEQFVAKALDNDIYVDHYNGTAVRKLCSEAKWRDDIVMSCDKLAGGIGNLKVNLLACLRYSIESGAMLIPPVIHLREAFQKMEQSFNWSNGTDLSYMFDTDHLYHILAEDCPQLRFVNEKDESLNIPPAAEALSVNPKKLLPYPIDRHVLRDPSQFRPALDALIQKTVETKGIQPSTENPMRLSFDDGISFSWPVRYDDDAFRRDWGHLAQLPHHVRALSARILYKLYRVLGAQQNPDRPSNGTFLGAHIRTESDAAVEGWTSFAVQAQHVRDQLIAQNLSVVYVATGTASDANRLKETLADVQIPSAVEGEEPTTGVQVVQKWDFLDDEDMILMDTLTWDQLALVDLDIMQRASHFVGIWESSWSWTIALKRHAWSAMDPYDYATHHLTFVDEYSILYGPEKAQPIIDPCFWL
ncbi:hypothetical protein N0V82_006832 [Gnomoniopsis sp. IMI 355080]|nr:hypothetical protein N0V82_006832 [Gnomoniopsis sp. IMI 355080]